MNVLCLNSQTFHPPIYPPPIKTKKKLIKNQTKPKIHHPKKRGKKKQTQPFQLPVVIRL